MTHIDESRLLAVLDGELASGEAERVRDHLDRCEECLRRQHELERLSRLFSREVERLDTAPPVLEWEAVVERSAGDAEVEVTGIRSPGRAATFLKAAAILLVVTGVAAAIPGSPVDDWIGEAAERITGWIGGEDEAAVTRVTESGDEDPSSPEVAVALERGEVTVTLTETAPGARVDVSLVSDGTEAEVQAPDARYRTSPGRIEAVGATSGPIQIRLPEIASSARVVVAGRTAVVLLESGRLRLLIGEETESDSAVSFRIPGGTPGG